MTDFFKCIVLQSHLVVWRGRQTIFVYNLTLEKNSSEAGNQPLNLLFTFKTLIVSWSTF
jgi:hypothetical protein